MIFVSIFLLQSLFIYSVVVLDFAKKNIEAFVLSGTALVRYLGVIVYFPLFLIPIYLIGKKGIWNSVNKKILAILVLVVVSLTSIFTITNPVKMQEKLDYNLDAYEQSLLTYEKMGELIDDNRKEQDKVCILYDVREKNARYSSITIHMRYFTLVSFDYMVTLDSSREQDVQIQKLADFISANKMTKVVYRWADDDFNKAFSDLFANPDEIDGNCICEVTWVGDNLKLKAIAFE